MTMTPNYTTNTRKVNLDRRVILGIHLLVRSLLLAEKQSTFRDDLVLIYQTEKKYFPVRPTNVAL